MDAVIRGWLGLVQHRYGRWVALVLEAGFYLVILWMVWRCWDAPRRAFPYLEGMGWDRERAKSFLGR